MTFALGSRSRKRLEDVHPDLVGVVELAIQISSIDFTVIEGLRTAEQQRKNIAKGVSWTMNSRHLTGHAVDLAPWVNGDIDWNDVMQFRALGHAVCRAAQIKKIPVIWGAQKHHGGDWRRTNDMPHFELSSATYPKGSA